MSQIDKILDFKPTGLEIEKGKLLALQIIHQSITKTK